MASILNATTSSGLVTSADNSGSLQLATNNGTTAVTIDTSQRVAFVAGTDALPSITTTGDTNTGIFFPAADTMAFAEGGAESMRVTSDGKVCIGITTAQQSAMLSVTSGANNTSITLKGDSGTNCGSIRYTSATTGNNCWQLASNENNFFIFDADSSHYAYLGQDPTAWSFASDARIKKDIIDLPYGLATILAVQPRRFAYISDGKEDIGFVAQELQAVVPEAVVGEEIPYSDDDTPMEKASKTMGVSKDKLIPILVKAIQELKAELDATKAEVQALKGVA